MDCAHPIPFKEPTPVMMHTLSLRRDPRGEFWRCERMLSSLARVLLRKASLVAMVGGQKERMVLHQAR